MPLSVAPLFGHSHGPQNQLYPNLLRFLFFLPALAIPGTLLPSLRHFVVVTAITGTKELPCVTEFLENARIHLRQIQLSIQMETALTLLASHFPLKTADGKP